MKISWKVVAVNVYLLYSNNNIHIISSIEEIGGLCSSHWILYESGGDYEYIQLLMPNKNRESVAEIGSFRSLIWIPGCQDSVILECVGPLQRHYRALGIGCFIFLLKINQILERYEQSWNLHYLEQEFDIAVLVNESYHHMAVLALKDYVPLLLQDTESNMMSLS